MAASVRRRRGVVRALASALLVFALAGCDRRLEPYVPPEDEPPPTERPVSVPGLESPVPRARMPLGPDSGAAGVPGTSSGEPIRGRIVAGSGVSAGGAGVLFVIARTQGGGPPLAVKRMPIGPFPLEFEIGPGDVMIQGRPFAGPITLTARIDRDGNPMTREPEDASATLDAPVEPGAQGVELRLEAATSTEPDAPSEPSAPSEPTGSSGEAIRGRIVAGDGVRAGGAGVLYLIARAQGGGPPLAVKRMPIGPFPLEFEIGPADVMIQGRPFAGPITLTARIDRDGNPMTRDPDEASAALEAPVEPGAQGIELRLEAPAPP